MQALRLMNFPKQMFTILIVSMLAVLIFSQTPVSAIDPPPSNLNTGPYVDKLVYKVISYQDQRILALQAGEVELDTEFIDPVNLLYCGQDPDIDIYSALRNGYGHISINCEKYPLNISGLRRAFAYAFDKIAVTWDIMDGFSQEHDSLIPYANGWCIEDDFDWHYYTDQSDIGNQILDDLGFEINTTSGFRLAPNGNPFEIRIEYASSSSEIGGGVAQIGVDALHRLHVNARTLASDFNEYISRLDGHDTYDMVFYTTNFYSNDIDWLGYEYWSEYAYEPYQNPTNFRNATYDSWREQLLYGTTYEEIYEASAEMQQILHYNVPRLVVYMNIYMQGYRNDRFTGHVEDLGKYITGPWTMRKIQKLDGTFGSTVPIAIGTSMNSFNFFVIQSSFSGPSHARIFDNLHSSLFRRGPDLNPWPDLAKNMITETHSDNPTVPDGHTRFTIDIVQNATWSDGEPLTAEDVAFTFAYQYESRLYGNPAAVNLADLVAVYTPNQFRVVLEYCTESYWHFSNFAFDYIIPEHIFNDVTGIGYDGWNTWNPVFDPAEPFVTCGPFIVTDYEDDEFCELSFNPLFHYLPPRPGPFIDGPIIRAVSNISYQVGTVGNEIVWFVEDDDPSTYSIYLNGDLRESGFWTNDEISHNIDGLPIGNYTFTLNVSDSSGNSASSSVHVSVVSNNNSTGTDSSTLLNAVALSISSVSGVIIIVVIISIFRHKTGREDEM